MKKIYLTIFIVGVILYFVFGVQQDWSWVGTGESGSLTHIVVGVFCLFIADVALWFFIYKNYGKTEKGG